MKTALLVIDVQRALCEGEYEVFEADSVIDRINLVCDKARDAKALVVFIQHEAETGILEFNSEGWQLAKSLRTEPTDRFIRKTAADSFHRTTLEQLLRDHGVSELVICGLQSEFCIDTTTRRALALGFAVVLVADAHSTLANKHLSATQIIAHHTTTLANLHSFGPRVCPVNAEEVKFETSARAQAD